MLLGKCSSVPLAYNRVVSGYDDVNIGHGGGGLWGLMTDDDKVGEGGQKKFQ